MSATTAPVPGTTSTAKAIQVRLQRFGAFASSLIMPNLPAFLAWGLITTLFIAKGWAPNGILGGWGEVDANGWQGAATQLATADDGTTFVQYVGMVGPMITYLLPLLLANTGGRVVYGTRGAVVASIVALGMIVGSTVPMFLGAMIVGPLAAWVMKKIDAIWAGKVRPGFEMLVDMFSAGIVSAAMAIGAFFGFAPIITNVSTWLGDVVNWMADHSLLPLMSVIVEPAKVLFLNNAIGNGALVPLGLQQVHDDGKSLLFLVEANPGPGLGILMAFTLFGVGAARSSAPGAAIIQFFGGIHEVYFPFVLMKPTLIIAAIAGGATGVATMAATGAGLNTAAAPGSIIAVFAATERNSYVGVIAAVVLSFAVTFVISAAILRASRKRDLERGESGDLASAIAQTEVNKGKSSTALGALATGAAAATTASPTAGDAAGATTAPTAATRPIHSIVFACDAGMGSSAMGASILRDKLKKAGHADITVVNRAVANLDDTADLVITHSELTDRAKVHAPSARHVSVENFLASPVYDQLVAEIDAADREGAQA